MAAQRLSADIRWVVAGVPDNLERHGVPLHPLPPALLNHRCHRIRLGDDRIHHWDCERGQEALTIAGAGLAYLPEPYALPLMRYGALRVVLGAWSSLARVFTPTIPAAANFRPGFGC